MEDILDATFYRDNDDFLTRTLTSSVLYDKHNLNISLIENNNNTEKQNNEVFNDLYKDSNDEKQGVRNVESPNLDFLKIESPDLEQILLNITDGGNSTTSLSNGEENVPYGFNFDDDLSSTENYLTDALQDLHDKNPSLPDLSLIDVPNSLPPTDHTLKEHEHKVGNRNNPNININHQLDNKKTRIPNKGMKKSSLKKSMSSGNMQQYNVMRNNQKSLRQMNMATNPTHVNMLLNNSLGVNEHVLYDNNLMARVNPLSISHMQQKQQEEIAFLSQAMGYPQERENFHMMNQNSFQQKFLAQHYLQHHHQQQQQQQQIGGHFQQVHPHMNHMAKVPYFNSIGVDDQTLKMFVDNPQLAPVNLEIQELVKRERKKLRNRIASSKCRKRKLEREGKLEDKVKDLKERNIELNAIANALKQQICDLKQRVMDHIGEGCQIVLPS